MSVTYGPHLAKIIAALDGDYFGVDFRAFLRAMDTLVQAAVLSKTLTAPPGSPVNGARYIVATGGSGAWSGKDNQIAVWTTDNPATPSGLWEFYAPGAGWHVINIADSTPYWWNGTAWVVSPVGALDASAITTGQLALARGGTNADLSATGGATQVLAQNAAHVVSARALVAADIPAIAESGVTNLTTDLAATEKTANKGAANGYASLDATTHIPLAQIPAALVGALQFQGVWDASANSPALASGVGTKGFFYKVSVAGSTTIDTNANWHVGDLIIFDGTVWDKVDNYEAVTSVAGRTGAVTIGAADLTDGTTGTGAVVRAIAPTVGTLTAGAVVLTGGGVAQFNGVTSGNIQVSAPAVAGVNALTLPAATDTLVGKATTDTLTNKTFDANATGNVLKVGNMNVVIDTGRYGAGAIRIVPNSANVAGVLTLMPNGSNTESTLRLYNGSDPSNTGAFNIDLSGATVSFSASLFGSGTPVTTIDASGIPTTKVALLTASALNVVNTVTPQCATFGRSTLSQATVQINYSNATEQAFILNNTAGKKWSLGDGVGCANGTFGFYDYTDGTLALSITSGGYLSAQGISSTCANPQLTLTGPSAAQMVLNAVAGNQATFLLQSGGVNKWVVGKQTDDSFLIYDPIAGTNRLNIQPGGGAAYFGGGNVDIASGYAFSASGTAGVTAGSFSSVTAIQSRGGIIIALTGTSDERLKTGIKSFARGLDALKKIEPILYRWNEKGQEKTGFTPEQEFAGFSAQNVQGAIPEAVAEEGEYLAISDRPIIAALVNAVKALVARVEELEGKK